MKLASVDELFERVEEVKAPPALTQKVMMQIEQLQQKQNKNMCRSIFTVDLRRLGISMMATAALLMMTALIPLDERDIFHRSVQAQTSIITQQANRAAYDLFYSPVRKFSKLAEDVQKEFNKIKEDYQYGK